ncbi:UNVERIFIED_CONTAM: hypothetical protein HDU68_000394 [Siphonaria sp. JEL0065]|nr:hypothetical protein HDU68_000394 [Siphonaria sp. JEL0065]
MQISSLLSAVVLASTQVSAHGFMGWPITRILPGDQQNGYTFARAAANRNTDVHPDPDINCQYLPKGQVYTQTMAPGTALIDYTITAFHLGGCNVTISRDNQQTWQQIGYDPTCGVQTINTTGRGSVTATIPDGTYSAVLRWSYYAENDGAPNEIFHNCADINVAPSGSNQHLQVEMMGGSGPWTVQLPKSPWQFQSASCSPVGSTLCAGPGSSFVNQCVSLPAGGGFAGGSSYYEFQCPYGSTCQTVNGVDACVGGNIPTSTTTTTKAATTTTSTTTRAATSTTTTTTLAATTATTTTTTTKTITTAPTVTAPTRSSTTTTRPVTTSTTTTTKKAATTTAGSTTTAGAACTTYGAWACNNSLICSYGSSSLVWVQVGTVASC